MTNEEMNIGKLNELYSKSESCDKEHFAEARSNILLMSGDHFKRVADSLRGRFRDVPASNDAKIRLTKNHTKKAINIITNAIWAQSPGVKIVPYNESETQDQKAAELNDSVYQSAKYKYDFRSKWRSALHDFTEIGECWYKIFWDENKGPLVGYQQKETKDGIPLFVAPNGELTVEPQSVDMTTMQAVPHELAHDEKRPIFKGDFVFEKIYAFNLMRCPSAETMEESPYLIIRKMLDYDEAMQFAGGDEAKVAMIKNASGSTYKVFDAQKASYSDAKEKVMFREYYFRPSAKYPEGYYYITTEGGILAEDVLPYGIWPIIGETFESIQTTPRGKSRIRSLRPIQGEINRAASSTAQSQMVLGEDKILVQKGASVSKGAELPGIRVVSYSGAPPTVLPGRSGEQYFNYLVASIDELYKIAEVEEEIEEKVNNQDPYAQLYMAMRFKKKFVIPAEKFQGFQKRFVELYLKLARKYLPDDEVIRAVGRREAINIAEFKATLDGDYSIKVEESSDDIESLMGKNLQIREILQYIGKDLKPEVQGQLIRGMSFLNKEEMCADLTLNYDNVKSDILALDRGQYRPAAKDDDHDLYLKKLKTRMKQRDFEYLNPQIQAMYQAKYKEHEDFASQLAQELQAAQAGFIPSGGALVKTDYYVNPDPNNPQKSQRALLPAEAIGWLIKKLEGQGSAQKQLAMLSPDTQVNILSGGANQGPLMQGSLDEYGSQPSGSYQY